ncbi:MATE family efflux transporter [Enterococcus hermanniensis]|uniref:Cation efflux pump n=1 Tax=Enterococcus hermanniensis TaxID=249189 RepID=A0A1L8TPR9_9ENTE|nr:MATE family efflux transporter [Enterococcus hermanniensis]OJG46325.1 cation efflux pump [Enterococcus hermanniensis]
MEQMMDDSNEYLLKEAPVKKAVLNLSVPMMIGTSVGAIYNVVNAYFIGLLHNTQMISAITIGTPVFIALMAIGNMFGVGASTYITRLIAVKDTAKAKKVAGYGFYMSLIVALLLGAIGVGAINPLLKLLGVDAAMHSYALQYVVTLLVTGFTTTINFTLEQVVRSEGAAKESMYGMIINVGVNLIFDPLLILFLQLHVIGAALAIGVANLASMLYYLYYLSSKSEHLKGFATHIFLSIKDQIEVLKIGVSELMNSGFMIISTLLLNVYAVRYGDDVVAGFGIATRLVQVPQFLVMGIFFGVIPLFAYNYSSKNKERLTASFKTACAFIALIVFIFVSLTYLFRYPILGIFTNSSSLIQVGEYILTASLATTIFNGFAGLILGMFQGTGKGLPTIIISIIQSLLIIPIILYMNNNFGLHGLVWASTVTEFIAFLIGIGFYLYYRKDFRAI